MKIKRLLCFALGLFMLVSCSCSSGEVTSSQSDSSAEESSEDTTSEVQESEYAARIDKLLCGTSDRTLHRNNALKGLTYKTSIDVSAEYPDSGNVLTDGITPLTFNTNGNWAGYSRGSALTVDFDLGCVVGGLLDFNVTALDYVDYGIYSPSTVKVFVAGEDKEYAEIGTAYRPDGVLGPNEAVKYNLMLHNAVEARYIRFQLRSQGGWLFLGEISALSYDSKYTTDERYPGDLNGYYGYKGIPEVSSPAYWNSSESDYTKEINLVASKKAYISAYEPVDDTLLTIWYNDTNTKKLTDGVEAKQNTFADTAWFHITQGFSRSITYDLTKTSAVKGFSVGFLHDNGAGVLMPTDVAVLVSENGKDWQKLFYQDTVTAEKSNQIVRIGGDFEKAVKARYVRVDFCVYSHLFMDEIVITGTKDISNAADVVPDKDYDTEGENGYLMPEDFFGVNNMLLSYNCSLDENNISTDAGRADVDEYLPYLAYLDEEGNIKDTFFDAVLYLPYVNMLHDEKKSVFGRSADGWRNYVDDVFYEDRNMDALSQCAERVYSELGITDQKIKVFTSILYTFPKLMDGRKNNFGDIDGDGKAEDFSKIEDRKKAIKWIMDEQYNRFKAGNYKNLEFCGFYWFEEAIDYNDPHEKELIRYAVDYAHKLDCKVFWIPYRTATGINDWKKLGFDAACLQPNYMFLNNSKVESLYTTAKRASKLGMCVELEISGPHYPVANRRFIEYLNAGATTGFMQAVKMYYQDGVPGAFHQACYSEDPTVRRIYDYTYLFAKEKYQPILSENNVISDTPLEFTYKSGKNYRGQIDLSAIDTSFGELVVTLSPKYGNLKLNRDGSFVYYPAEDYSGNDSFKVAFDIGYGELVSTEILLKCQ